MTEHQYLASTNPATLLAYLRERGLASDRKQRLFACACCLLIGKRNVKEVEEYERKGVGYEDHYWATSWATRWEDANPQSLIGVSGRDSDRVRAALLRDIFGNPFRPVTVRYSRIEEFQPGASYLDKREAPWLTPNVLAVAQTIYEERRFDEMPILADALEEAGCTNEEILSHLRGPGLHVRGCFVVDLILGQE